MKRLLAALALLLLPAAPAAAQIAPDAGGIANIIGPFVAGDCIKTSTGGGIPTLVDTGAPCGGGGGGAGVNPGTIGQLGYYAASGSVISGTTPGTGVLTALGVNIGSAGAFVTFNGAGGTPSSLTLTNATGLPTGGILASAVTYAKIQNGGTTGLLQVNNGSALTELTTTSAMLTFLGTASPANFASALTTTPLTVATLGGNPSIHSVIVDVAGAATWETVPNCTDTSGNHLNYAQASDTFSCGTSSASFTLDPVTTGTSHTVVLSATEMLTYWTSATAGAKTTNIPGAAAANQGYIWVIKTTLGNADTHTVTPASGTIDGNANLQFPDSKTSIALISDGSSNWMIAP